MASLEKGASGSNRGGFLRLILISMRPHQWVKNLFIFAPLLFGRKITDPSAVLYSVLAFVAFCLLSGSLYIFNDVIDAKEDRSHPEKCNRPISAGALSPVRAIVGAGFLSAAAFGIAVFIGGGFVYLAAIYFFLTVSYCLVLKKMIVLDGIGIAIGFVLRVVGGAVAIGVVATHWLIVCAFLLALMLAFGKRRQEILMLTDEAKNHRKVLEWYSAEYLDQVNNILIAATIVCYSLYTVAPETVDRFGTDALIYGTVFVIYGLLRYKALIRDPEYGGNPSRMMMKDKPLFVNLAAWGVFNLTVIYWDRLGMLL